MTMVTIYTDGACHPNPGRGGWGALLIHDCTGARREIYGGADDTTNNRMEMMAAIKAIEALTKPCHVLIYTDSQYLRNGITSWVNKWRKNGWKTSTKEPVKNEDLWRRLDELTRQHTIMWKWVKGHNGDPGNERADELASLGRKSSHEVAAHSRDQAS